MLKAARHAFEHVAVVQREVLATEKGDEIEEMLRILGDAGTQAPKKGGVWLPIAGSKEATSGFDMDVHHARVILAAAPRKHCPGIGLIWGLVFRKPGVAVNTKNRFSRITGKWQFGSVSLGRSVSDETLQGPFHLILVNGLTRRKPRPVIILCEVMEEPESFGTKAREGREVREEEGSFHNGDVGYSKLAGDVVWTECSSGQPEGAAVMRRGAIPGERLVVLIGRIAFVLRPAVVGVLGVQRAHERIAGFLGDDGRGSNGQAASVSFDGRFVWAKKSLGGTVAIHKKHIGHKREIPDSAFHGFEGGMENVEFINFFGRALSRAHSHGFGMNTWEKSRPLFWRKLLAIMQAGEVGIRREDDSGSYDRASKASSSRLVHPGHIPQARCPVDVFEREVGFFFDHRVENAKEMKGVSGRSRSPGLQGC